MERERWGRQDVPGTGPSWREERSGLDLRGVSGGGEGRGIGVWGSRAPSTVGPGGLCTLRRQGWVVPPPAALRGCGLTPPSVLAGGHPDAASGQGLLQVHQ